MKDVRQVYHEHKAMRARQKLEWIELTQRHELEEIALQQDCDHLFAFSPYADGDLKCAACHMSQNKWKRLGVDFQDEAA